MAVIVGPYPSASETFLFREWRELRRQGVEVDVFSIGRRPADHPIEQEFPPFRDPGFFSARYAAAVFRIGLRFPFRSTAAELAPLPGMLRRPRLLVQTVRQSSAIYTFADEIRRRGITHVHGAFANFPATIACAIGRILNIRFTFAAHARDVFVRPEFLRLKLRRAAKVVACSESAAEPLRRRAPEKVAVIHHGLEPDFAAVPRSRDRALLAAVGRLVEKKGFAVLLSALARLKAAGRTVRCEIAGDGPEQVRLQDQARQLKLEDTVRFRGWMPPEGIADLLGRAAVLVVPSVVASDGNRDGIPNVLLEAAAVGTPLVAGRTGGIAEFVKDGETGLLVRPGDPAALAETIAARLDDADGGTRLAAGAKQWLAEQFDLRQNVADLIRHLFG